MKTADRVLEALVRAGFVPVRWFILAMPDAALGKMFRAAERLAYAITGDPGASAPVAEVADIFESGKPYTTTVRKMIREAEADLIASTVRTILSKSPHGAI